jgi:RHS repeat-associated protein
VWRWDQGEPFGNDTPNGDPNSTGATFDLPLRLPGQYFDRETNLSYNYYRDYDPSIGRYVQSDPIGIRGGLNTYLYVAGKPVRFADPWGLDNPGMGAYGPYWSAPPVAYNRPPPWTVPVNPGVEAQVQCMMMCLGRTDDPSWPPPEIVVITGGSETWTHTPPSSGGRHHPGEAVDLGAGANPGIAPGTGRKSEVNDCACKCKFTHGGWEPDWSPRSAAHYHVQNGPGAGVPSLSCRPC